MKTMVKRLTAGLLTAVMLVTGASAASYSSSVLVGDLALSDQTSLHSAVQKADGDTVAALQENIVTYSSADKDVWPIVAYGSTLYGRSAMSVTAKYLADNDLSIVAGVNGAFFDLNTGIPYGLVITEGVLRSSGNVSSVGFYKDGSAIIGSPELVVQLETRNGGKTEIFYNKALSASNGVGLYSVDYDNATKSAIAAYNVILEPTSQNDSELLPNDSVTCKVTGLLEKTASCTIPDDGYVLAIAENSIYATALANMKKLEIGDTVTITTSTDRDWDGVEYACGGGEMLVENGDANTKFTLDSAKETVARTAVGLKKDGSLVLYTADYGTASKGLTLAELAERMEELGCVTALNLDGGGSTTMGAQYPGYSAGATVNKPSDGSLRACANFIFLVRETKRADAAEKLYLYPYDGAVLLGSELEMTVKAADNRYMSTDVPSDLSYNAVGGTISDKGVFTAGGNPGTATVTVKSGSMTGTATVNIVDEPTSLTLKKEDAKSAFKTGIVAAGSVTELTAVAGYYGQPLTAQDSSFTWNVTGDIGTINADGTFTATNAAKPVSGTITVSIGKLTATAEVTVSPSDPFKDMSGHWAKEFVNTLYFEGVLTGSTSADGTMRYRPNDSMTRQEFVVALMRFAQVDTSKYAANTLSFDDASKLATWAQDAMKAAVKLGYIAGSNNKLNPTATISRQEAMVILARSQKITSDSDEALDQFSDSGKVASWASNALSAMVSKGIIGGSNGKLNPTGNVTRAEIAKMLYAMENMDA